MKAKAAIIFGGLLFFAGFIGKNQKHDYSMGRIVMICRTGDCSLR